MLIEDARKIVIEVISEYTGKPPETIAHATLDELGLGSLDRVQIAMLIETKLNITEFPNSEALLKDDATVDNMILLVQKYNE